MAHKIHMIIDLQFGSTGKGLLAGYLARKNVYDTAICAFSPNAGHTFTFDSGEIVMTQQLPTAGLVSSDVRNILIGPGASIHIPTLEAEIERYSLLLKGKKILIHPHAGHVSEANITLERVSGMSKIGSTTKGVGASAIQRIQRATGNDPIMKGKHPFVVTREEYDAALSLADNVIVEGAQGFSLSMYHGFYPWCTSRDVTPWQIAADCGLPFRWASNIQIFGTMRTYPIRVNNRDGFSGPVYDDQDEIEFEDLGLEPELTTVTKLPRRIFTFSDKQVDDAVFHCGHYWDTKIFLNFANYLSSPQKVAELIKRIEAKRSPNWNAPNVAWIGYGAREGNVYTREEFERILGA